MQIKQMIKQAAALATAISFIGLAANVHAQAVDKYADLKPTLAEKLNLEIDSIQDAPIEGLLSVNTNRGLIYITPDTNFVIQGAIFEITPEGFVNHNEEQLKSVRLEGVKAFSDSAIEFKAKEEKHVITVFTDTTCGYCQKLHKEMKELNDYGITVNYLAFPRAGIGSDVYDNTVSIWCADDPQGAITTAKLRQPVAPASCANDVAEHYKFGQKIGVNGTPNIILPDGSVQPGYVPAARLSQLLNESFGK
jgi:thiol:disulfide interchange protein DsbC